MLLELGPDHQYDVSTRALVMGILNRTPDSFYDGGDYWDFDAFLRQAEALVDDGVVDLRTMLGLMTCHPAALLGLDRMGLGALAVGGPADVTVIDPDLEWRVVAEEEVRLSESGERVTLIAGAGPPDRRTGDRRFRVSVPPVEGETLLDDNRLEEMYRAVADVLIAKPFQTEHLLAEVRRLLEDAGFAASDESHGTGLKGSGENQDDRGAPAENHADNGTTAETVHKRNAAADEETRT